VVWKFSPSLPLIVSCTKRPQNLCLVGCKNVGRTDFWIQRLSKLQREGGGITLFMSLSLGLIVIFRYIYSMMYRIIGSSMHVDGLCQWCDFLGSQSWGGKGEGSHPKIKTIGGLYFCKCPLPSRP
jgi:hypothetical protein